MPIVDSNRLKGNQAAFLVSAWLGKQCLVRPVSEGTDVGVDLFCETVDVPSEEPFLHFWVQVKTGAKQIVVADGQARCSFDKGHVDYWCRQPVPAYAFLVPEDQLADLRAVYVVSFALKRLKGEVPFDTASKTLSSDFVCSTPGGEVDLASYATRVVPLDHMLLQIFNGVSGPLPSFNKGYIQRQVRGFRADFGHLVAEQIRQSASATAADILDRPRDARTRQQERQLAVLVEVLRPFTRGTQPDAYWERHYEDYVVIGRYLKESGSAQAGREMLESAVQVIKDDELFQAQVPGWQEIVKQIQAEIAP